MCLRDQGIDDNNGGVGRVRWDRGLSDNDGGFVRGRVIRNASEVSETTREAAGSRQRARGIYNEDRGVGGGR